MEHLFASSSEQRLKRAQPSRLMPRQLAGVARTAYRIPANGFLEIRVISEPALTSEILQLDVPLGAAAAITAVAPSPYPSETPEPSVTPVITATSTPENQQDTYRSAHILGMAPGGHDHRNCHLSGL